ncbi:hypothetical protein JW707_02770 [Candidatus Woesearchaeota archaeon]|nr:hypothetical protein [Candidatus Woesearchaeota archaeon]
MAYNNIIADEARRLEERYGGNWQYSVAGGCFKRLPEPSTEGTVSCEGSKGHYARNNAWTTIPDEHFTPVSRAIIERQRAELEREKAEDAAVLATATIK